MKILHNGDCEILVLCERVVTLLYDGFQLERLFCCIGPCRTELERMKQFKNNQDDEFSNFSQSNPPLIGSKGKSSPELEPYSRPKSPKQATGNPRYERIENSLGLGELDGLTIMNEAEGLGGMEVSNMLFVIQ